MTSVLRTWTVLFLVISGCSLALSCAESPASGAGSDCRNDGLGCPNGSVCVADVRGDYYCGPSEGQRPPEQDAIVIGGADASQSGAGGQAGAGGRSGSGGAGGVGTGGSSGGSGGEPGGAGGGPAGGGNGGGGPADECGQVRLLLKPSAGEIARVYVVVDRSYSMVERVDRWTPMMNALENVTQALDGVVQFGLVLFPDPYPEGGLPDNVRESCAPGRVHVPVAHDTSAEIVRWLDEERPRFGLGTPTASALQAAGEALSGAPTGNDYILLATDGGPGCNFALDYESCVCLNGASCLLFEMPQNCLDRERTVTVVRNLVNRWGIKTFVLGLTDENFLPEARGVLDEMAVAGQTAVDGRHFEVGRLDELQRQLAATAGGLVPCIYDLGEVLRFADRLEVSIDGQVVQRDRTRTTGWAIVDDQLEFTGAACAQLRDGRAHEVRAECR